MTPLELLIWVGAICGCLLAVAITAAIIVGGVKEFIKPKRAGNVTAITSTDAGRQIAQAIDDHARRGGSPRSGR